MLLPVYVCKELLSCKYFPHFSDYLISYVLVHLPNSLNYSWFWNQAGVGFKSQFCN